MKYAAALVTAHNGDGTVQKSYVLSHSAEHISKVRLHVYCNLMRRCVSCGVRCNLLSTYLLHEAESLKT